jgi:transmembrane sensor
MDSTQDKATSAIREAAAEWIVRLSATDVTPADKVSFAAWLRRSPAHVKEYLRAEVAWLALQNATRGNPTDVRTLLCDDQQVNVVALRHGGKGRLATPLHPEKTGSRRAGSPRNRNLYIGAMAATLLLTLAIGFSPRLLDWLDTHTYSTAVGEQRHLVLADGSAVELNTRSKIRVYFNKSTRDVYLAAGEAFFDVAKDPTRPFRVLSDAAVVRALGTQFDVYRQTGQTLVSVIEGRVAIEKQSDSATSLRNGEAANAARSPQSPSSTKTLSAEVVEMSAGAGARIATLGPIERGTINPQRALAWRQRRLIFENETLAAAIADFNRYNVLQLTIDDPALAAERISGIFDANKPRSLVRFLAQNGAVEATELPGARLLLQRAE